MTAKILLLLSILSLNFPLFSEEITLIEEKAEDGTELSISLSKDQAKLGENLDLKFEILNCENCELILAPSEESEEVVRKPKSCFFNAETKKTICKLSFLGLDLGKQKIPEIEFKLLKGNSEIIKSSIGPLEIEIIESKNSQDTSIELKPVKVHKKIVWPYYFALSVIIGILIFFLIRYLKKRFRPKQKLAIDPPPRPPFKDAVEFYNKSIQSLERGKTSIQSLSFELSEQMRSCIVFGFKVGGLELTSAEIKRKLNAKRIDRKIVSQVDQHLAFLDQIKFTDFIPDEQSVQLEIKKGPEMITMIENHWKRENL